MNRHEKKARELVDKFFDINPDYCEGDESRNNYQAKQCALLCVDHTINTLNKIQDINVVGNILLDLIEEQQKIKQAINDL